MRVGLAIPGEAFAGGQGCIGRIDGEGAGNRNHRVVEAIYFILEIASEGRHLPVPLQTAIAGHAGKLPQASRAIADVGAECGQTRQCVDASASSWIRHWTLR